MREITYDAEIQSKLLMMFYSHEEFKLLFEFTTP